MKNLRAFLFALPVLALGAGAVATLPADAAGNCPNGKDYKYVSRNPETCLTITYMCEPGYEQFFNECGCGCKKIGS